MFKNSGRNVSPKFFSEIYSLMFPKNFQKF